MPKTRAIYLTSKDALHRAIGKGAPQQFCDDPEPPPYGHKIAKPDGQTRVMIMQIPFIRILVGLAFIALSGAMLLDATLPGFLKKFSPTGEMSLMAISMISGLTLPPLLTGLHTLFLRQLRSPWLKREFRTMILGSLAAGFFADFYTAYTLSRLISFALIIAMVLVGSICLFVIRKAPEGPPLASATP